MYALKKMTNRNKCNAKSTINYTSSSNLLSPPSSLPHTHTHRERERERERERGWIVFCLMTAKEVSFQKCYIYVCVVSSVCIIFE